jgi:transcriptional regulator with XRE-family HTH domain
MSPKDYKENLGKLMYSLRWEHRMSMHDVATKCGIMPEQLSPFENGKGNPTLVTVARIAGAFDLKLSEFFAKLENNEILAVKQKGKKKRYS